MKLYLLLLFCLMSLTTSAQIINFPDPNFKNALLDHSPVIDTNGDNEIQVSEANAFVAAMDVEDKDIADLSGIEFFINIPELNCSWNDLTSLDISNNLSLVRLDFALNRLTELDVSSNLLLEHLDAYTNNLTSINLGEVSALKFLDLRYNELTALDLSDKESLEVVWINYNQLTSIDILGTSLIDLDLIGNNLTELDLTGQDQLIELSIPSNNFISIDLSGATNLEILRAANCELESLDISQLNSLRYLSATGNELTTINTGSNSYLTGLVLTSNSLTSIDLSGLPNLGFLDLSNNSIMELDLSASLGLQQLDVRGNNLGELNLQNNTNLERLNCGWNELTELDVSTTRVVRLKCHSNPELSYINLKNDRNWQFLFQYSDFSGLMSLSEVCLDQDWQSNPEMMAWINSEVGHEVTYYNNDSCDEFVLSIDEHNITKVELVPNPAHESVQIIGSRETLEVRIYNLTGQLVLEQRSVDMINLGSLNGGVYFVELIGERGQRHVSKLVKQ